MLPAGSCETTCCKSWAQLWFSTVPRSSWEPLLWRHQPICAGRCPCDNSSFKAVAELHPVLPCFPSGCNCDLVGGRAVKYCRPRGGAVCGLSLS